MKKLLAVLVLISILNSSCATLFKGKGDDCQRTKPVAGAPARKVRVGFLVWDICTGVVPLVVDFATGAIYKPCVKK